MEDEKEIKMTENPTAAAVPAPPEQQPPELPERPEKKPAPKKPKHLVRKIVIGVILAVILLALLFAGWKFFGGSDENSEVMNAVVDLGTITSTVSGEGLTRAKESASLTLAVSGIVQDVYVQEGDVVKAGQKLYSVKSEASETAVAAARKEVDSCTEELHKLQEAEANLTVRAPHGGKLLEVAAIKKGDNVSAGTTVAKVADDSKMRLTQYFSYAYKDKIKTGQSVTVSVPSAMAELKGKVSAVHMVERISAEGTKLFEVEVVVDNPGTLAAETVASATVALNGETAFPYESGKLAYYQESTINTKVGGDALQIDLRNYAKVRKGDVLLQLDGGENDTAIFNLTNQLNTAKKTLEEAEKAAAMLQGVSPIDGKVMNIGLTVGAEVPSGTVAAVVADTSAILMDADVDERNVGFVKPGMPVSVDQWGTEVTGEVQSVSLTSKVENGMAKFPAVISIDNADGRLTAGGYAQYSMVASQSDDCMVLPIQTVKSVETAEGTVSVVFVHTDTPPENTVELEFPVDGVPEKGYYPVPVTTGINDNQNIEILDGVEVGMEVFQQVMYNAVP